MSKIITKLKIIIISFLILNYAFATIDIPPKINTTQKLNKIKITEY